MIKYLPGKNNLWTGLHRSGSGISKNDYFTLPDGKRISLGASLPSQKFCQFEPDNYQGIQNCVDYNRVGKCLSDYQCYQDHLVVCEVPVCDYVETPLPGIPYTRCSKGSWYVSAEKSEGLVCYTGTFQQC